MADRDAAWLRAIGLGEGATVTVLRRAPLGGPLHLRVSNGAELAVDGGMSSMLMDMVPRPGFNQTN